MSTLKDRWEFPFISRPDALIDALNVIEEAMDGMTVGDLLNALQVARTPDTATLMAVILRDRAWVPKTDDFYRERVSGPEPLDLMDLEWISPGPRALKVPRGYRDYPGSNRIEHEKDLGIHTKTAMPHPDDANGIDT